MNEREDVWPIMIRGLKPAPPTMADWARSVDAFLKQKAALDRQRAEQATTKKRVDMCRKTTLGQQSTQAGTDPEKIPTP